eukprot:11891282-Prorocentrum_lima.AAC.1
MGARVRDLQQPKGPPRRLNGRTGKGRRPEGAMATPPGKTVSGRVWAASRRAGASRLESLGALRLWRGE